MLLIITLTKEVDDEAQAQALFEVVLSKLEDQPSVTVQGRVNQSLITPEPPE